VLADALAGKPLTGQRMAHAGLLQLGHRRPAAGAQGRAAGTLASWRAPAPAPADAETTTRLWLKALAASDDGKGIKADAALRERVQRVLADPAQRARRWTC
jgi:hypothetical protein